MLSLSLLPLALFGLQAVDLRNGHPRTAPEVPVGEGGVLVGRPSPDVLIILADDFNWVDLASVAAPNINALASRGMTFRNGYSFPLCSITRYSVACGRYPRRDGIGAIVDPVPPGPDNHSPTLGIASLGTTVRLAPAGFLHSSWIGKWHLGTNSKYDGDPDPDVGEADIGALTPLFHGFDRFLGGTMANLLEGGGKPQACGWLIDRYGVRWQIVPKILDELMRDPDQDRAKRVTDAMLQMVKIDVAALKAAARI